jgi:hypothetical protein
MSRIFSLHTPTLLLVLAVLGCGDSTAPASAKDPGFEATVSGLTAQRLSGGAVFAADLPGFGLALVERSTHSADDTVRHAVYFRTRTGAVPQPGEYAITAGNYEGFAVEAGVVLDGDTDDPLLCVATAGILRIQKVTDTRLEGSFTIAAGCAHVVGGPLETPIAVTGTFLAARGSLTLPDESESVAGQTYVLASIDDTPLPYLYRDLDIADDHLRIRTWISADTIRFGLDGQLGHANHVHQLEESTETQEVLDDWEWESWRGGFFRQSAENVAVAWAFVTIPSDAEYSDTLRVAHDVLVRRAHLPPQCLACPVGPEVDWRYVRR